ncbi:MAG: restriction endonuclease subunit S [Oliverpabstia sp.]|nr:restriction endonuclease subunit S [Oliverpabstia sp.]
MQGNVIKKDDPECCPVLIDKNDTQDLEKCEDVTPDAIKKCEGGIPNIRFRGFKDDWEQRKLGGLCDITTGKLDANAMVQDGQFDFYTSGVDVYKIDRAAFEGPAITIAGNGASVGYMHLVDGKFNAYQRTYVLTGFLADRQFLNVAIGNELPAKIQEEVRGSGIPYIVLNMLTELNIPFPSHNEQKQIGEFFRNLDHLITLHQRKCDETRELKKYMLQKMFPKDGKKVPEIRFKGFTGEWEQRKVREVADRYDNLRIPVAANLRIPGSTPYYGANGIQDYVEGYTHEGEFVLVAEDGANDLKNYPVKCVKGRIWVNNHAHVLQGKNEITDNRFLAFAISQADIESLLVGGGRAKLNAETLMGLDLLLPVKQEQVLIGNYFANLDRLVTLYQRKCDELKEIKRYMLQNMFP